MDKCFRKKSREAVRKRNYFKQIAINDFLYVSISVAGDLNHWGWGGDGRGLSKMFREKGNNSSYIDFFYKNYINLSEPRVFLF